MLLHRRHARQGVFERHKPLLSLHLCASVLLADEQMNRHEYAFLFTGGGLTEAPASAANPDPEWITPTAWQLVCKADQLEALQGLQSSIEQNLRWATLPASSCTRNLLVYACSPAESSSFKSLLSILYAGSGAAGLVHPNPNGLHCLVTGKLGLKRSSGSLSSDAFARIESSPLHPALLLTLWMQNLSSLRL